MYSNEYANFGVDQDEQCQKGFSDGENEQVSKTAPSVAKMTKEEASEPAGAEWSTLAPFKSVACS